jgi:DNA-binding NarL/FixJ family response regulator
VATGLPDTSIAPRLRSTEKTVEAHLTCVFGVFGVVGVSDRTRAALRAQRQGLS